ncbi:OmpW family outer membrane protein [Collimonas sp. H4R21]|jgi:outer membrane protein|uniref:OmpW family outer membrane protein n=1 Tax=Collimonas rhizosphaerae TaxID=3126357 RepID=A0ABU9PWZ4_9BURK|nr:OmpW family outer membrane protein [Collimonas sp. OK412]SFD20189.1 outer membrane protein [Collimonas sp. OK412]
MKKQFNVLPKLAALSVLAAFAAPAMAQQAGDNVVNVGWAHLGLNQSSEPLKLGTFTVPNSGAHVSNADTAILQLTHFFTDNIAVTADLGIPPKFKLSGAGSLNSLGQLGTATQWSPAIVAKYFFGDANSQFRPFVGAGATYVWYSNIKLTSSLTGLLGGGDAGASTSADLSSSFAPVGTVGMTYNFDKNWSASFSLSYVPLDTKADLSTRHSDGTTTHATTKITLNPLVSILTVGYKF